MKLTLPTLGIESFGSPIRRVAAPGMARSMHRRSAHEGPLADATTSKSALGSTSPASVTAATSVADIFKTVHLLYSDRATPQGSLLQWRLYQSTGLKVPCGDLRAIAEKSQDMCVVGAVGSKNPSFVVLLVKEPACFCGFADERSMSNGDEAIPQDLLIEAATHLLAGGWGAACDPRHDKYEITEWLRERSDALSALTWGEVLCIVRWFIGSPAQVLGKRNGRIVPYPVSDAALKADNARLRLPTGLRPGEAYMSSWHELSNALDALLKDGGGWVRISDLKKTFREKFATELTETAFGHTTLLGLLGDERCASVASLDKPSGGDAIWLRRASSPREDRAKGKGASQGNDGTTQPKLVIHGRRGDIGAKGTGRLIKQAEPGGGCRVVSFRHDQNAAESAPAGIQLPAQAAATSPREVCTPPPKRTAHFSAPYMETPQKREKVTAVPQQTMQTAPVEWCKWLASICAATTTPATPSAPFSPPTLSCPAHPNVDHKGQQGKSQGAPHASPHVLALERFLQAPPLVMPFSPMYCCRCGGFVCEPCASTPPAHQQDALEVDTSVFPPLQLPPLPLTPFYIQTHMADGTVVAPDVLDCGGAHPGMLRIGQHVIAKFYGEWYPAIVRCLQGNEVQVQWVGEFSMSTLPMSDVVPADHSHAEASTSFQSGRTVFASDVIAAAGTPAALAFLGASSSAAADAGVAAGEASPDNAVGWATPLACSTGFGRSSKNTPCAGPQVSRPFELPHSATPPRFATNAAAAQRSCSPSALPPWCSVRNTFLEVGEAPVGGAAVRTMSAPPCRRPT